MDPQQIGALRSLDPRQSLKTFISGYKAPTAHTGIPVMERADRACDLSDKQDMRVSSEIIRSSLFGMSYLSDKRDTRVSYITR